jgi:hypothetical protein
MRFVHKKIPKSSEVLHILFACWPQACWSAFPIVTWSDDQVSRRLQKTRNFTPLLAEAGHQLSRGPASPVAMRKG